ncbi:protein of unknown function [Roseovarius lutimaris]|uniref:DUF3576 domain-containing protein n=1 Tax=Roseovarius lutimaris TaxID=1005928 RepID=A0A1I5E8A8_9RHOB|nr:DUF3576 domain-containing protein [Roseovarius lutimaris]SFO07732.1 protein of unknown function [Roseovarius lutimaris]
MIKSRMNIAGLCVACLVLLAGCGGVKDARLDPDAMTVKGGREARRQGDGSSVFDVFKGAKDEVQVNRFLWTATLQVLDFLPVEAADPFTGVISTGYGTPPGGGQAYRATVLISDPALDARSLNVALQSRGGPVSAATERAVEDAILSRARQLRINAARF